MRTGNDDGSANAGEVTVDRQTLTAYENAASEFAEEWETQPVPVDMQTLISRFFVPGSVADIGCGSGRDAAWLSGQGFQVTGYDASPGLLEQALLRHPGIEFRVGTLPRLEALGTARFDNVYCETVIMHLPAADVAPAVRRLVSLVRPGGRLYLSWRVNADRQTRRDDHGRLYTAVDVAEVRAEFASMLILHDADVTSSSSGKMVHRIIASAPGQ
jgi:SAM-dependent methyltransferase